MAAEQLELQADDPLHRHDRPLLRRRKQTDLDVPAAGPQRAHAVHAGRRAAERVEREGGPAAGELQDGLDDVLRPSVDDRRGAEGGGELERARGDVDRDHLRARGHGDLHGRQPDPAAAVHDHPLARCHPALLHHGAEGGGVAASERCRCHEGHLVRQGDQVDVGRLQRDELGERAPVREARLGLPGAHLVVATQAGRAAAAGADERHGHPVADPPAPHLSPDCVDGAGQLVARHVRQTHVGVMSLPAVPVAAADAGGTDPYDDPRRGGRRRGDVLHRERPGVLLEDQGPH